MSGGETTGCIHISASDKGIGNGPAGVVPEESSTCLYVVGRTGRRHTTSQRGSRPEWRDDAAAPVGGELHLGTLPRLIK